MDATLFLALVTSLVSSASAVELTFALADKSEECFYEVVEQGTSVTIEYQVVTGGNYDVDVVIEDMSGKELYKKAKEQYGTFTFKAERTGEYRACFSNEFSTFSHKLVYVDFQVGGEKKLPGLEGRATAMTIMETSAEEIHEQLNTVVDYQTHHRLRETQGRKRAEDLNERVMIWSAFVTAAIALVGFSQVMILKSFFSEKKPSQMYGYH